MRSPFQRLMPGRMQHEPAPSGKPGLTRREGLAALAAAGWSLGPAAAAQPADPSAAKTADAPTEPARRTSGDPVARADRVARPLRFPADFGAHPDWRTEWWYVTGWLADPARVGEPQPSHGFQLTFFRQRTDLADTNPSAFAARQLIFAHAAVTDLAAQRLRHDQRIARAGFGLAEAAVHDTQVLLHAGTRWSLQRAGRSTDPARQDDSRYTTVIDSPAAGFALDLELAATQPLLLQGQGGWSRKGPRPAQASHYCSQPQLAASARLALDGRPPLALQGRAWLDHEWSESLLDADAVGWDWIGMNLFDGSSLTAFRLRRAEDDPQGPALWAGGSWRPAGGRSRDFAAGDVRFVPLRHWIHPGSTGSGPQSRPVRYPVEWRVETPAGHFRVRALLDDQELDSRASTGTVYWEGLSELLDVSGQRRLGLGYLEMTGYAQQLRI